MDTNMRELAPVSVIACFGLALAWAHEADLFAIYFANAAAVAIVEAARRWVRSRGRYTSRATDQVALLGGFLENVGIQFVSLRQSILRMPAALGYACTGVDLASPFASQDAAMLLDYRTRCCQYSNDARPIRNYVCSPAIIFCKMRL